MIWLMVRGELPDPRQARAAGGGAGRVGRPRPAGAVDRDRPDGGHLRRRAQQRHGVRRQRARRRRTAAPASSASSCCTEIVRVEAECGLGPRRRPSAAGREPDRVPAGLRAPLPPGRPAPRPAARAGRRRRSPTAWSRAGTCGPRGRSRALLNEGRAQTRADEHRRRHRGHLRRARASRRRWPAGCSCSAAASASWPTPGRRPTRAGATRARSRRRSCPTYRGDDPDAAGDPARPEPQPPG